jgi:ABC-2 type transport system permease protein
MSRSMTGLLIAKDLYLYRGLMALATLTGFAALALGRITGSGFSVAQLLYATSLVALGIFIGLNGVLRERQEKSLLFVMSLPVSPMQYTTAKIVAALIAFLTPWAVLLGTTLLILLGGEGVGGLVPSTVSVNGFFLSNFCVLLAVIVVTSSERWAVASILLTNMSVSLYFIFVGSLPGIADYVRSPSPVWTPTVLAVLAIEAATCVLSIGVAFYLQSRKRDFL